MEIEWLIHPIDQQRIVRALNCSSIEELKQLLDTIYERVANDLKAQPKHKPVVKFVPLIRRTLTFNPDTGKMESSEEQGMCRLDKRDILIVPAARMKRNIIHELVHWLRPDLKENETKQATRELINLWKLRVKE